MASADLWPSISASLDANSTRQMARSPRVLRTHLHTYARRLYLTAFRTCIGLCIFRPAHPTVPPLTASCSSRQRFASGFLPTPGRPGNRCLPLTLAHVGCVEDFHFRMGAPCRAHQKKTPAMRACEKRSGLSSTGAALRLSPDQLSDSTLNANGLPFAQAPEVVLRQPMAATVTTCPAVSVRETPAAVGSTGAVLLVGTTARM